MSDLELPTPLDLAGIHANGVPPVQWIAEPYLVEQEIVLWIGDGYTGKSMVALDMAVGLAGGLPVILGSKPSRPYRVMVLDEDGGTIQTGRRLVQLVKGRLLDDPAPIFSNLKVFCQNGLRVDSSLALKQVDSLFAQYQPEIVVFDALRAFHGYSENNSDEMAKLMRHILRPLLRKHSVLNMILLHHTSKDMPGVARRSTSAASRGSTEIRNAADLVIHFTRQKGVATVAVEKARNVPDDERPGPQGFTIVDTDNGGIMVQPTDTAGLSKMETAKRDICRLVGEAEIQFSELFEGLIGLRKGLYGRRTAINALDILVAAGPDRQLLRRESGRETFYRKLIG